MEAAEVKYTVPRVVVEAAEQLASEYPPPGPPWQLRGPAEPDVYPQFLGLLTDRLCAAFDAVSVEEWKPGSTSRDIFQRMAAILMRAPVPEGSSVMWLPIAGRLK